MKYSQPALPPHPGPMWPLPAVSRGLDAIVADIRDVNDHAVQTLTAVRADADEKILALEVTAARLAAERDEAKQAVLDLQLENSALVAAAFVLVADGIRREEELTAALAAAETDRDEARRERNIAKANSRISGEITAAMSRDLEAKHLELRHVSEQYLEASADNEQLRTELDDAVTRGAGTKRRRLRRGR